MIQVTDLTARTRSTPKAELGPMTFGLEARGSYALVGAPHDGVDLLLAVLAGEARPRKGTVLVGGSKPGPRATVAYVPYAPDLPSVLKVDAYLRFASQIRGEPATAAEERLAVLGVAPLAGRRIGTLTLEELRAVALVEALTSRASLLLLAEPLSDVDPRACGRIPEALAARVRGGATVVLSTASRADAALLGHDALFFERGKLARRSTADDSWAPPLGARGARLFVRSEGARYLLSELAADPTFQEVHGQGSDLVVTGKDPVAMAVAVAVATRRANVEVDLLQFEEPDGVA
jgi:ABC-type multidrug transport system ATPase subunit